MDATRDLLSQLLKKDIDLLEEVLHPKSGSDLQEFPLKVKALFVEHPGFINDLKLQINNYINGYVAIVKLFKGDFYMINQILDSIKDNFIKTQVIFKIG